MKVNLILKNGTIIETTCKDYTITVNRYNKITNIEIEEEEEDKSKVFYVDYDEIAAIIEES